MIDRFIPSYPGDWPEDFALDNGNYLCRCTTCREPFIGYKRRMTCKPCAKAQEAWWATLTPEQQREHETKVLAEVREIMTNALDKAAQG